MSFTVAMLCARSQRLAEASQLLGCSKAWNTAHNMTDEAWEARLKGIITAELQTALGGAEFDRLHAAGAAMTDDEAHRLLCAVLDLPANV